MPTDPAVIETPGDATANSYATVAEFKDYVKRRRPVVSWVATASDDEIASVLLAGARELDACFAWTGTATDDVQSMAWPRIGMLTRNGFGIPKAGASSIPIQLKDAQCEFALQLDAADRLSDNDPLKKGITSLKAGSVALTFSDVQGQQQTIESADVAIRKMQSDLNYVSDVVPAEVRRLLVPSWFTQHNIKRPILFRALQ